MFIKIIAAIVPIIVLSLLIVVHELFHFFTCRLRGVRVERFSLGFGPRLWGTKKGDTDYCLSAVPFGGYVKIAGEEPDEAKPAEKWEFFGQPVGARAQIIAAGPLGNYLVAYLIFLMIMIAGYPVLTARIGDLIEGYPAETAGLRKDDRIVAINGKSVNTWDEMVEIIEGEVRGEAVFTIERENQEFRLTLSPKVIETTDVFGRKRTVNRIGVTPSGEVLTVRHGLLGSVYLGAVRVAEMTGLTLQTLWSIVTRKVSAREAISGPVGVYGLMREATEIGIIPLAYITAAISVCLAVINILPFPALDGGHLLFLALEKVRKRPVNRKIQEAVIQAGFFLLILLMLFVVYNDILKLIK